MLALSVQFTSQAECADFAPRMLKSFSGRCMTSLLLRLSPNTELTPKFQAGQLVFEQGFRRARRVSQLTGSIHVNVGPVGPTTPNQARRRLSGHSFLTRRG